MAKANFEDCIIEPEKVRRLAHSIKNRKSSKVRFYRHIALLVSQNIRDLIFDVYLDGRPPQLSQRENGCGIAFNGDVSDALEAFEEMIPNLGKDNQVGTFSKFVDAESWERNEKVFFIEARYNCSYVKQDFYKITIRFNTKLV